MDRKIHTLANLRARSALLTTSVLCAAALSTEKDRDKLERLYAHADAVHMTVVARNAKSQEIVLVSCPATPVLYMNRVDSRRSSS